MFGYIAEMKMILIRREETPYMVPQNIHFLAVLSKFDKNCVELLVTSVFKAILTIMATIISPMRYRFIPGSIRGVHNLNLKLYQDI
jgi:hypothetical protein